MICVATAEILAGVMTVIFNAVQGHYPLAEYKRVRNVPVAKMLLLGALFGGPVGAGCNMMATTLCGVTYTAVIVGMTPVVVAIMGHFFLKEKLNLRAVVGILVVVGGCIVTSLSPPEGVENFYLGIIIALFCPVAFSLENVIGAHASDVTDPRISSTVYRLFGGGIIELALALLVCLFTGNMEIMGNATAILFLTPRTVIFMICTALFIAIQYGLTYAAYTYCGAVRAGSIQAAYSAFTIPVGALLGMIGVAEYHITKLAIVSTIITVIGIILVIGNPREIFTLRNND